MPEKKRLSPYTHLRNEGRTPQPTHLLVGVWGSDHADVMEYVAEQLGYSFTRIAEEGGTDPINRSRRLGKGKVHLSVGVSEGDLVEFVGIVEELDPPPNPTE